MFDGLTDSAVLGRVQGELARSEYCYSALRPHARVLPEGSSDDVLIQLFETGPDRVDLSEDDPTWWLDPVAIAAVTAAKALLGVSGLWGSWARRVEAASSDGERIFLVEVEEGISVSVVSGHLRERLAAAGAIEPQVEVIEPRSKISLQQRSILDLGALLWLADKDVLPEVVPVFDSIKPEDGRYFGVDHPRVAASERADVVAYLCSGRPVLQTLTTMMDVVDPNCGDVVPMNFFTDGNFVWPQAVAYYVQQYGLAPYPPLLEAIRASQYALPRVMRTSLYKARTALFGIERFADR